MIWDKWFKMLMNVDTKGAGIADHRSWQQSKNGERSENWQLSTKHCLNYA